MSLAWKRQATLQLVTLCCLSVALALAGVALMLWAVIPSAQIHAPWVLWVTPLPPLALAAWCRVALRPDGSDKHFDSVRRQWEADLAMLREVSAP